MARLTSRPASSREPRAIARFLDAGHPWMAFAVTMAWLRPGPLLSVAGLGTAGGVAILLRACSWVG